MEPTPTLEAVMRVRINQDTLDRFAAYARSQHRSVSAQARLLIERAIDDDATRDAREVAA